MKNNAGEASGGCFSSRTIRVLLERYEPPMALLKKHIRLPALLVLLLILFGLSLASAREEEIVLDNPDAYGEKHRAAVTFPHELHVGNLECLACHHDYKDGENILSEDKLKEKNPDILCAACHDADAEIHLKKAYHRQCMGCHRYVRLAGSATGPELCGECHNKRIKSGSP
jgi:hypothetical protein